MQPLVSILMPAYNAEPWISDSLTSALNQTWKNIEIIVVDDGSSDQTLAIARQFAAPNVKIIHQENQGASTARNQALKIAQGEFIQYLDADDLLAPDKIECQVEQLQGNLSYVASGQWGRFYQHPHETKFIPQPLWSDMQPVDWLLTAWKGHWMMHPAAWLIPKQIADQAGIWNQSLSLNDDGEYFCRVVLASQGVKFCAGAKSFYRSGLSHSLSRTQSYKALQSLFCSIDLNNQHLLIVEDSLRVRRVCADSFQRFIYEVYPKASNLLKLAEAKVQTYGGSTLKPCGGPLFQGTAKLLGWRNAKHLQQLLYDSGYQKLAVGWKLQRFFREHRHLKWQKF